MNSRVTEKYSRNYSWEFLVSFLRGSFLFYNGSYLEHLIFLCMLSGSMNNSATLLCTDYKWDDYLNLHKQYKTQHLVSETIMKLFFILSYFRFKFLEQILRQTNMIRISWFKQIIRKMLLLQSSLHPKLYIFSRVSRRKLTSKSFCPIL